MPVVTLKTARVAVLMTTLALWPAWLRLAEHGPQRFPAGLVLLAGLLGWWLHQQRRLAGHEKGTGRFLLVAWLLLLFYGATLGRIPPLGSQGLAMIILANTLLASYPPARAGERISLVILLPLTLPLEMAMQFLIGFPFRRLSAEGVGLLLSSYGVVVEGTTILYRGRPLEVDAACSGVLGLWAFVMVGGVWSLVSCHRWVKTIGILSLAVVGSLGYNVIRTSMLFMYRYHSGLESSTTHTLLGAVAFLITLLLFAAVASGRISRLLGQWKARPA